MLAEGVDVSAERGETLADPDRRARARYPEGSRCGLV